MIALNSGGHVEHLWTLVCQRAEVGANGSLSLSGLLDMITVDGLSSDAVVLPFDAFVLSAWRRNLDPGTIIRQRVVFAHPDGQFAPLTLAQPVELSHLHLSTLIVPIRQLPLRGYGQYFFVVQREKPNGDWEDTSPSAGLWVARPDWKAQLEPGDPLA